MRIQLLIYPPKSPMIAVITSASDAVVRGEHHDTVTLKLKLRHLLLMEMEIETALS